MTSFRFAKEANLGLKIRKLLKILSILQKYLFILRQSIMIWTLTPDIHTATNMLYETNANEGWIIPIEQKFTS